MKDTATLVTGIENKIRKLLEINDRLNKEIDLLTSKLEEKEKDILKQQKELELLKERNILLKLVKSIAKEESKTDIKLKINELVREIDQSIGLLNR